MTCKHASKQKCADCRAQRAIHLPKLENPWYKQPPVEDGDCYFNGRLPNSGANFVGVVRISTLPWNNRRMAFVAIPPGEVGNPGGMVRVVKDHLARWEGVWSIL